MATSKKITPTTAALGEKVVDTGNAFLVMNVKSPHKVFVALSDAATDENTGWIPLIVREGVTRDTFNGQDGDLYIRAATPEAEVSLTKDWS